MKTARHHRPLMNAMALLALCLTALSPARAATGSGTTTALSDTRDYTLVVASAQGGNPTPPVGTNTYAWRATVTASVEAVSGDYTCTGWTGSGAVPPEGGTTITGAIVLDEVASSVEWQWEAQGGEFDPSAGLVLHYPMDGNANDASGSGNNGTVVGASLVADRFGNSESAYGFDGTAHIEAQGNPAVDPNGNFTYAFWIRVDSLSNWTEGQWYLNATPGLSIPRVDFGSPESTNSMKWYIRYDNNSTPSAGVLSAGPLHVGSWKHYVITRQFGTTLSCYMNGALMYSFTDYARSLTPPKPVLGAHGYTEQNQLKLIGAMDEFRIYNRALSSNEVAQLYALGSSSSTTHTVTFDLDGKGERTGGGALVQQVAHGAAAVAPTVAGLPGWTFTDWDQAFDNVTGPLTVTALYTPTPLPDLTLLPSDLRILNAAGVETWSPAVGEAVTVEVTVRNTGAAATTGDILVQLFLDGAPTDLAAYDLASYTVAASTVVAESMVVGGSRTLLLPWTATGPDRVATLTAVAEFAANRAQSQANAEGAAAPLPVPEVSFANNSVGRSLQIGSPAAGDYGIEVHCTPPPDMVSGVGYTLAGTARYDWGANGPVLGALVTVTASNQTHETRTSSPNGAWSVPIHGLPAGHHPALVQVFDGRLTGSTNLTLVVGTGPQTVDLRVKQIAFASGTYHAEGETGYAETGSNVVLRALIRNDGNAPSGSFTVDFLDALDSVVSSVPTNLAAFSEAWVTATAGWPAQASTHTLSAVSDSASEIEETNEHNNSRTCTVIGTATLPDMVVSGLAFDPAGPKAGDTVTITATIHNQGAAAVTAGTTFGVSVLLDGVEIAAGTAAPLSDLAPGGSITVAASHTFAAHGAFTVAAQADSGGVIAETREDNNSLAQTLTVRQALPDLRPFYYLYGYVHHAYLRSGLSFSPAQPVAGDNLTINCDIYNVGTVPLSAGTAFDVVFMANGDLFTSKRETLTEDLPVGGKITVSKSRPPAPAGTYVLTASVDTAKEIAEEHETNNETTAMLIIVPADAALVTANLTTSPLQPLPGSAVILTATLRNDGGTAGGAGATVEFFAGSTAPADKIGETTLDTDIAPKGGSRLVAFAWNAPATPGIVPIFAKIGDSTAQRNMTVTANPAPNLQVFSEDIVVSPSLPHSGDTVTVLANIRNTEGSAATDFQVRFFVDTTVGGWVPLGTPRSVAQLSAGSNVTLSASTTILAQRSAYSLMVEIVPNAGQGDADSADNAATTSFLRADTPVADAGEDLAAYVAQLVTLDGTASRNATIYDWTLIERPLQSTAELTGADTATPRFTPGLPGTYRAQLIVSDGLLRSQPDFVVITVGFVTLGLDPGRYGVIDGLQPGEAFAEPYPFGATFPVMTVTPLTGFEFLGWEPAVPVQADESLIAVARYRPDAEVMAMAADELHSGVETQQTHGLYTPAALRHMFPSPLMIAVDPQTGEVRVDLQMQWCDDLVEGDWQPLGEPIQWTDTNTVDKAFYRLLFRPGNE